MIKSLQTIFISYLTASWFLAFIIEIVSQLKLKSYTKCFVIIIIIFILDESRSFLMPQIIIAWVFFSVNHIICVASTLDHLWVSLSDGVTKSGGKGSGVRAVNSG